jgi:1-acyl-sn-glycerol-3-phosphate acyltransferase
VEYLLATTRIIVLVPVYLFFGLIGFGLLFIYFYSKETYYRKVILFSQMWAQCSCFFFNIKVKLSHGPEVVPGSLIIANHVGAPDIFVMGACFPSFFVAKSEIKKWPFMGWLTELGATIFVDRNRKQQVSSTVDQIQSRLKAKCSVILFPEAQATDGKSILPFKSSHFEAALQLGKPIVPVVINYHDNRKPSIASWYNISFSTHLIRLLKQKQLDVTVQTLPSLKGEVDRKILAKKCYDTMKSSYLTSIDRRNPKF